LKTNGMFQRIMEKYRRFLYGRYGHDSLNRFISVVALVLCALSFLIRSTLFPLTVFILLFISLFRQLSKNHARRARENQIYERAAKPVKKYLKFQYTRFKLRNTHKVFTCAKCHSILRVPKNAGAHAGSQSGGGQSGGGQSGKHAGGQSAGQAGGKASRHGGGLAVRVEIKCPKCGSSFTRRIAAGGKNN